MMERFNIEKGSIMSRTSAPFICLLVLATACGGIPGGGGTSGQNNAGQSKGETGDGDGPGRADSGLVEAQPESERFITLALCGCGRSRAC